MEDKITLLTREQVEKKGGKLKYINLRYLSVFRKCGLSAKPTDFDIIQGGGLQDGTEDYWLKGSYGGRGLFASYDSVGLSTITISTGIRPVIPLSKIYQSQKNLNISKINGIEEIEYGEYPQSVVNERLENELEFLYQQDRLSKTEKKYTLIDEDGEHKYQEYKYYGNKYIRVYKKFSRDGEFSNGRRIVAKNYWVKVEPIKWLVNRSIFKENNLVVSKKVLVDMPFSYSNNSNYEESDIKKFIEKYLVKDIVPSELILTREEERIMNQKELLDERLEKSQSVYDAMIEKEKKVIEEAKRLEKEKKRQEENEIRRKKELDEGFVQALANLDKKYKQLLECYPNKIIKHPHFCVEKDILCYYDVKEKCYKIKDDLLKYLPYIEFPLDMDNVDIRGLDLRNTIISGEKGIYKKSFKGCNLNGNDLLRVFNSFEGYNFDNAKVYSDDMVYFNDAFINTETIKSINKKYIKEALDGAILDKYTVEFLNNNREEYGIDTCINVKVRSEGKIEDMVLFSELSHDANLENIKYMKKIKELKQQGYTYEDLENMLNIMKEKAKNEENNTKHI